MKFGMGETGLIIKDLKIKWLGVREGGLFIFILRAVTKKSLAL